MYLLEEDLKFPKDSFKSMKYQPYEMKPSFSMVRVYQWWNYWYGEVYISFSGGLDSTVLAYIVCQAYRKYKLTGKIPLVFADTGTEFPEIREFVKTYTEWLKEQFPELDIELVVIRPKHSFKWVCENKGFPITSKDTAGKIRKLRHGKLSEKYRNYLLIIKSIRTFHAVAKLRRSKLNTLICRKHIYNHKPHRHIKHSIIHVFAK